MTNNSTPTGSVDELRDAIKDVISDNTSIAYDDRDDSFTAIDDYSGLINGLEQLILARKEAAITRAIASVPNFKDHPIVTQRRLSDLPLIETGYYLALDQLQSTQSNMKENKEK